MYVMSTSGEGAEYLCVPPDPGIRTSASAAPGTRVSATPGAGEAAALGACASAPLGIESSAALHTFTLDSGASRCFFRDRTALEPLARPVAVSLADPSGGPVVATSYTVLPCPAVPSGTLSGLHLPSFSTNLVAGIALQDGGVHQFTPAYERVTHCTCARTGRHLATFTRQPGSDLYTLTTESPQVAASASASASGQLSAPCSCRSLAHENVLWHHRLGHPSVQRLRAMHSRYLVSGLPRVLPPLPPSPAPPCLPCVEGRQRVAPHSSSFPPTAAPLQTLHMDVWGPARVRGQGQERYFLIVVDDYSRYTTVFPLRTKGEVPDVLIPWIRRARLQLSERFHSDFPVLRLHSDRGGEFSSDLLAAYCAQHGIEQSFMLPASPQQNGVAERCIGLVMEVARTSLIHAAAPHFLWPFAVRYAAHQLNPTRRMAWPTAGAADPGAGAAAGAEDPGVGAAAATAGAADPGAGAEDPGVGAATGAVELGVGAAAGAEEPGAGVSAWGPGAVPAVSGVAVQPRPSFVPLLQQVLGLSPSTGPPPPLECPLPVPSQLQLQPVSPLPAPSPYTGPTRGLAERREPASRPASPVRAARTSGRGSRPRPPPVPGTHRMFLRPSTAPLRAPLPSPPESSLPALADPESDSLRATSPTVTRLLATVLVDFAARCRLDSAASLVAESESVCPPSVGGECALGTDVLEDRQEEFQCLAAASPHLVSVLLTPEGDPDALDIPTPRSYAEAIEGTYDVEVPPTGANIVSGMWIFRVKRPPGSPPVFKARYVARGFSQRQGVDYFQTFSPTPKMTTLRVLLHVAAHRDYELHSLDFSTAFLQGSLHEEIWLRRPLGFTGSFPPGTQWSLRRPVYGLCQAPREWHDTLRTTLAALGFAPSTADPSLFLCTDTSLLPFYVLLYVDDLVFATADTAGLAYVKSELQKRHTCTDLGELRSYLGLQITRDRARRTITLTQSHMV
ncbi:unnamed protein product [Closterium sp. NIES-54]